MSKLKVLFEKSHQKRQFSKFLESTEFEIEPYRKKKKISLEFDF